MRKGKILPSNYDVVFGEACVVKSLAASKPSNSHRNLRPSFLSSAFIEFLTPQIPLFPLFSVLLSSFLLQLRCATIASEKAQREAESEVAKERSRAEHLSQENDSLAEDVERLDALVVELTSNGNLPTEQIEALQEKARREADTQNKLAETRRLLAQVSRSKSADFLSSLSLAFIAGNNRCA